MGYHERMRRSPLAVLFLVVFLDLLGFGMVLPLLPFYALKFGTNALGVGALMTVYSLLQLVMAPVWGGLSDRVGRRPVLLGSLLGSALSLMAFGLAGSLWALVAARALAGAFTATIGVAQAAIADVTAPEDRAKGMGLIGAAFGLGFVFGPAFGGFLAAYGQAHLSAWGPLAAAGIPAFVAAALALANFLWGLAVLPETLAPAAGEAAQAAPRQGALRRLQSAWAIPGLAKPIATYFLVIFAFATVEACFPLLLKDRFGLGEAGNGYVFGFLGILIVINQGGLVGRLAKRVGEKALGVIGPLVLALSLLLVPYVPTMGLLLLSLVPMALGNGWASSGLTSLISLRAEAEAGPQGQALGAAQAAASLGRVLGPLWGGLAYQQWGAGGSFAIAAGILVAASGLMLGVVPPPKATAAGAA